MDEITILNLNIACYALFVVYFYKKCGLKNLSTIIETNKNNSIYNYIVNN